MFSDAWLISKKIRFLHCEKRRKFFSVAAIAQLVERFTRNEEVPSSSLGCGSEQRSGHRMMVGPFFYWALVYGVWGG